MHLNLRKILGPSLFLLVFALVASVPFVPIVYPKSVPSLSYPGKEKDLLYVFFGFPSCNDVCPNGLKKLADKIDQFPETKVLFINLTPWEEPSLIQTYTHSFHPAIQTHLPNWEELKALESEFSLLIKRQPSQIDHGSKIFLIERLQGTWEIKRSLDYRSLDFPH